MKVLNMKEGFTTLVVPIGTVSAGYGSIDPSHPTSHKGIDFVAPIGTKIYSPVDGIVLRAYENPETIGKAVIVKTESGYQIVFGHLSEIKVKMSQTVHVGDLLALSGSSGNSTGGHLHLGVIDPRGHFINPVEFFNRVKDSIAQITHKATEAYVYVDTLSDQASELFQIVPQVASAV